MTLRLLVATVVATLMLLVGAGFDPGFALAQDRPAPQRPPPPRVETPSPSPSPDAVWIAGHWQWQEGQWAWRGGRWERAQGRFFIPGRHRQTPEGWVWEPGRWAP